MSLLLQQSILTISPIYLSHVDTFIDAFKFVQNVIFLVVRNVSKSVHNVVSYVIVRIRVNENIGTLFIN